MTVQDLFKTTLITDKDKNEFCKYYLRYIDNNIKGRNKKQKLLKLVNDICNCENVEIDESSIIFFIPDYPKQDKEDCLNNFLMHKEDLFKQENIIDSNKIEPYSYEIQPMKTILGYQVSQACLYAFKGKFRALASILWEMTWFGYDMEAQQQRAEEELEILNNIADEVENHPENLIKWEDLKIDDKYKIKPKIKPTHEEFFDNEYQTAENIFYNKLTDSLYQLERSYIRKDGKQ
jgi:hypothetical protein